MFVIECARFMCSICCLNVISTCRVYFFNTSAKTKISFTSGNTQAPCVSSQSRHWFLTYAFLFWLQSMDEVISPALTWYLPSLTWPASFLYLPWRAGYWMLTKKVCYVWTTGNSTPSRVWGHRCIGPVLALDCQNPALTNIPHVGCP